MTTAIVYSFAVQAGLRNASPAHPSWDVLARQVPRMVVALLNGDDDRGIRFLPLMGFDGAQRRFFVLDELPPPHLALTIHRQEPPPDLVIDGCFGEGSLTLRILPGGGGSARFEAAVAFNRDDPRPAISRLLFEIGGACGWSGAPPPVPKLQAETWANYFVAADQLLSAEADLLPHNVQIDAALCALRAAPVEPLVRRLFLQLAVRAAAAVPVERWAPSVHDACESSLAANGPSCVEFVTAAAALLEQYGEDDVASDLRTRLAVREPGNPDAVREAAIALHRRGHSTAALPLLEQLVALGDRSPEVLAILAAVCLSTGARERWAQLVEELATLPSLPAAPARAVAIWLLDLRRPEAALAVVDAALRLTPEHAGLWLARAQVLLARGDGGTAAGALQRCLALEPTPTQRAEAHRLSRLTSSPRLLDAMREVDDALADGEPARALPSVRRLVRTEPQLPEAWLFLGVLRQRRRQPLRALRAFRRALSLDPSLGEAHDRIAVLLARRGRHQEARRHLLQAARHLPDAAGPRLHLAQVCGYLGLLDEGRGALADAARLGADAEQVAAVRGSFFGDAAADGQRS